MLARGTTSRSKEEIGALLADVGAERRYVTTPTHVGIEADGMARDLPLILDVLADELRRPAFAAGELAKAKAELENELLRADDDTSARAQERLAQLAFPPDIRTTRSAAPRSCRASARSASPTCASSTVRATSARGRSWRSSATSMPPR